jgi:type IV secretory pathway VirB10-like protein
MSITTERKSGGGSSAGRNGILALVAGGLVGVGCLGFLLTKAFRTGQKPQGPARGRGEARIAARAEAARDRAESGVPRMRQEEVGTGYQFDSLGNYVPPKVDGRDLPENQPLVTLEAASGARPAPPPAPPEEGHSWRSDPGDTDPGMARERREARKEERQDLRDTMLGYTTSRTVQWANRRADREGRGGPERAGRTPEEAPSEANARSMERIAALAERAMGEGEAPPPVPMPAEKASQVTPPGEVGDMRINGDGGPAEIVREGKFLDCVTINRVESDLAESPVMAQVARDFVSLDGRRVLVPAGAKVYGTAGRVQSLQQARLYVRFHKIVFPRRTPEETPKVAYFPSRAFPAMDRQGKLGVRDRLDQHLMLQFGAAVALGVFDGLAAKVESPQAGENPAARDLILARTSQNFNHVADAVIQRYANVVPTVTIREGTKVKVYFTQDVQLSPFMATEDRSWVKGRP